MKILEIDAYVTLHKASGIEVGDKVRVVRKAEPFSWGWDVDWNHEMDGFVGRDAVVEADKGRSGFLLCGAEESSSWHFPFYCLEIVEKKVKLPEPVRIGSGDVAEFSEDGAVTVGCRRVSFELLKEIYTKAAEVKGRPK